jgi:hypothetical protein
MTYTSSHFSLLFRADLLCLEYAYHRVIACTLYKALEQHLSATKIIRGYFQIDICYNDQEPRSTAATWFAYGPT